MNRRDFLAFAAAAIHGEQNVPSVRDESLKGTVLKHKATFDRQPVRIRMPRAVDLRLKNGMELVAVETNRVLAVALDIAIPSSTLQDPVHLCGRAEATAALLRSGAGTRDARQIEDFISDLGLSLEIVVDYGARATHIYATCLADSLDASIELLADLLQNPRFPQDELESWRKRKKAQLLQSRSAAFIARQVLLRRLYPDDPRSPMAASPDGLDALTSNDLHECHQRFFRPEGALFGVAGAVDATQVAAKVERCFGSWHGAAPDPPELTAKRPFKARSAFLIDMPDAGQATVLFGDYGVDRRSEDYFACMVLNRVLGEGHTSRLSRNLREDKGFTYRVDSAFVSLRYLSYFWASAAVRSEVAHLAIDEFLFEFRRIRSSAIALEELEQAKRGVAGILALSLEQQSSVLRHLLFLREYDLPGDYWDAYAGRIEKVGVEEFLAAAVKYLRPERMQLVVAGDARDIEEDLRRFGTLEKVS